MPDWAWKPTRQPPRSLPTAVVTTTRGGSRELINPSNASLSIWLSGFTSLVAQEQRVTLPHHVPQREPDHRRTRRCHRDGQGVTAHQRCDRQAQLVEVPAGDQLAQPGGTALAEHNPVPAR